jgi:hypothetical protein
MDNTLSTRILVGYLWRFLDEFFADEEVIAYADP